ncbi:MAG: protein translocase subunit SecF [Chloroflexi bacterium]|nr:protein translocase subunit SecF [Chloroflexota bacterium]
MRTLDLVGTRKWFFLFSGTLVVASLVLLAIPPTLRPGIEFTAGTTTLVRFERDVSQAALRTAYADLGHPEARIQSTGDREYLIRTSELRVPDNALIEVNPTPTPDDGPTAELGTVLLGADGAAGEVALRVFNFAVCDFGDDIEGFPAGTEAIVFDEVREADCETAAEDATPEPDDAGDDPDPDATPDDASEEEPEATATPDESAEEAEATPPAGEATDEEPTDDEGELLAYRVQVAGADGVTGFVAPDDTHAFLEPGEGREAPETPAEDLGERGEIEDALGKQFGRFEVLEFASVSAVVSTQAVRNATIAVGVAAVFIMAYIIFAFSSVPRPVRYASAAIVALAHDTIIVLGAFSLFGKVFETEINLMFVTGLLTIIGFSVHDTIVIFDRVRENVRIAPQARLADNVNAALVQTLGRSLNTSITLLFTILALLWLGGSTIQSFLVVLLVGVVAGAYSSIGIAAQVLVAWEEGDFSRLIGRFRRGGESGEEPAAT